MEPRPAKDGLGLPTLDTGGLCLDFTGTPLGNGPSLGETAPLPGLGLGNDSVSNGWLTGAGVILSAEDFCSPVFI